MSTIHFLNVKQGDCSVIQHNSSNVTVIDVCNASLPQPATSLEALVAAGLLGHATQKGFPVNPIAYMQERSINDVFRFVLTHPDMDHLDGIEAFFSVFSPTNFWDTANTASKDFGDEAGPYDEADWKFYCSLRDGNPQTAPKRLVLHSGAQGHFYNKAEGGSNGGDGLHVLSPTVEIVSNANACDDFNDCSYVLLYMTGTKKIVFGGDSHDASWDHILKAHGADLANVDLLIAPHHGRKSGRSYKFLDVLRPKLTFFGNAKSEDLAYAAWDNRHLKYVTNAKAGSMIADVTNNTMRLYVTNKTFAQTYYADPYFNPTLKAYFCAEV